MLYRRQALVPRQALKLTSLAYNAPRKVTTPATSQNFRSKTLRCPLTIATGLMKPSINQQKLRSRAGQHPRTPTNHNPIKKYLNPFCWRDRIPTTHGSRRTSSASTISTIAHNARTTMKRSYPKATALASSWPRLASSGRTKSE